MIDYGKEVYIPTKTEMACLFLSATTVRYTPTHTIHFHSNPKPNTITVRVECKFRVDETTRAELMQRFETINEGLKAQVQLMFGWDWLEIETLIKQDPTFKETEKKTLTDTDIPTV